MEAPSGVYEYRVVAVSDDGEVLPRGPGYFLDESVAHDVAETIESSDPLVTIKVQRRALPDPRPWEDR